MKVWKKLLKCLEAGRPAVLLVVAESSGSSPGRPGFKMMVGSGGMLAGSVGGGSMENIIIEQARCMLHEGAGNPLLRKLIHSEKASPEDRSGMICAGSQGIVLCPCHPGDLPVIRRIIEAYDRRGGTFHISTTGLEFSAEHSGDDHLLVTDGYDWSYREKIATPDTVFIFGGGHCSLALCKILATLDMKSVVIDDREDVRTMDANTYAARKHVMPYCDVSELVPDDGTAFVVIMTASHRADGIVLKQMLEKRLRYLGMLASRAKGKALLEQLGKEGFREDLLALVHTPIGLPISSHSPAEIAVSIAAEIIKIRNS